MQEASGVAYSIPALAGVGEDVPSLNINLRIHDFRTSTAKANVMSAKNSVFFFVGLERCKVLGVL